MNDNFQERQFILEMLELQENINSQITSAWREAHYPWYRAIWIECAELMDHHGWKWWKKQTPNLEQIHMELVDIWHFGLSDCLQHCNDKNLTADALYRLVCLASSHQNQLNSPDQKSTASNQHTIINGELLLEKVEDFAQDCLQLKRFPLPAFAELLQAANFSFENLVKYYIGKNALNKFRQDQGYKEGSYIKIWQGLEDNEHLSQILETCSLGEEKLQETIYSGLAKRYKMNKVAS